MQRIVTVTMNPTVDVTTGTPEVIPGKKLRCSEPRFDPGGGGINVARMVRVLGGNCRALFPVGGSSGELLKELCAREEVEADPVPISGRTRESLKVVEEGSRGTYRFLLPGPRLSGEEQGEILKRIGARAGEFGIVVLSGSLPPGVPPTFYREIAECAKAAGAQVALDTSGAPLREAIGPALHLVKPNRDEAAELAGEDIRDSEERQERLLDRLLGEGVGMVFLTLGADGALVASRDGGRLRFRPPQVSPGSPVGAGDSFLGAAVQVLAEGGSIEEAVRLAVAAAAATIASEGTSLSRRSEILALRDQVERVA